MKTIIIITAFLSLINAEVNAQIKCKTIENVKWKIHLENGKNDESKSYRLIPSISPLDHYIENLNIIDHYSKDDYSEQAKKYFSNDQLRVANIGKWGNFELFQVSALDIMHQSLVLKDCRGQFRIIYTTFNSIVKPSDNEYKKKITPKIMSFKDQKIVAVLTYVGGNKISYSGTYYELDSKTKLPKEIAIGSSKYKNLEKLYNQ